MISNTFFSKNIKSLRNAHHLSLSQLASFLGKKKSAVAEMEAGRTGTTLDGLTDLCNFFAISSDWLLGRVSQPYNNDVINMLEKDLFSKIKGLNSDNQKSNEFYEEFHWIFCSSFFDDTVRNTTFSLSVRANILFCFNAAHYFYLHFPQETNTKVAKRFGLTIYQTSSPEVLSFLSYITIIIRYLYDDKKLAEYNPNTPLTELRLNPQIPFYDIAKALEE